MTEKPALHVILLGPTGGPLEDRVSGILARSISTDWSPNSVVSIDAGTLLAGVTRIIEQYGSETTEDDNKATVQNGPFKGLGLPHKTPRANAAHVIRDILGIVLITHPHLDHLSGLVINSPMLEAGNGPKPLAALPSVLNAIKCHLFNDVVWPNMSDEDGGAGLITYQRLVGGGNPRFGRGKTVGYVQACNGLLTKCFEVSHGHHEHKEKENDSAFVAEPVTIPHGRDSGKTPLSSQSSGIIALRPREPGHSTTESTAFFLRDVNSGREIIVFGDVEPDSVSLRPRNKQVWEAAAPKIADGSLRAIFIECSYTDEVNDAFLYGHLCPRHLVAELLVLAGLVEEVQESNLKYDCTSTGSGRRGDRGGSELDKPAPARLDGLSVYVIHVKDSVTDGQPPGVQILRELKTQAGIAGLGCSFHIPSAGEEIWI